MAKKKSDEQKGLEALAKEGKLDSPVVERPWSASPPLTPEEEVERAKRMGIEPPNYSPTFVRPVTDPAPTMSAGEAARMFTAPVAGGAQPDWYDAGVVRPERMDEQARSHYPGIETVGELEESRRRNKPENPSALPSGAAPPPAPPTPPAPAPVESDKEG